jgi:lipopolysaccharide export system permease protein
MIRIVDFYVLRQVVKPLAGAMAIGLLVLLAERMVRLLDTILGKKNSFAVVFELLAYLVPHYLGLAVPAALFLGLLFGFNKLSKDSELDALMASGIGLSRLTRPVALLSILLTLISAFIVGWAQPHTRYAYRSVIFDVRNIDVFYLAEEGVFMQAGTRTFIIDKLQRSTNSFDRIFLFDYRGPGGSETVTATHGKLIEIPGERRPVLRLEDGHRLKLDRWPFSNIQGDPPTAVVSNFVEAETPLGKVSDAVFRPRGEDERELTLVELWQMQDTPPKCSTKDQMRAELHKRLVDMLNLLVLPFLAVPFATGRRRGQRAYRFGLALIILIVVHEVIEQGAVATRTSGASPYLTMWLPFALVTAFAAWRFWLAAYVLKADRLDNAIDRVSAATSALWERLLARTRFGAQP